MPAPGRYRLTIYRGDDLNQPFGALEPDGRQVEDLILTNSSTTATSASASFVAADAGKLIATADGTGITDGTTISTVVSASQITLSAAATASGTYVASVRALNCSGYSSPTAYLRDHEDAPTHTALTVDATRKAVGVFTLTLAAATTAALTKSGVWDWQVTTGGKIVTLLAGQYQMVKDTTHTDPA